MIHEVHEESIATFVFFVDCVLSVEVVLRNEAAL